MENRRRWYRRILIGFFLFMLLGTAASRIYDSVTVPKVLTEYPERKSIETVITGTGTVKEGETVFCDVAPGLRVESVSVSAGSEVKTGDELFRYQMSALNEKKAELEQELEKARLDLERMGISSETYAQVTQAELASRELELARQAQEEGQQEYDARWAEHFVNLKNLEADYEKKKMMTDDELILSQEQQLTALSIELQTAETSRDTQLREIRQRITDLREQIAEARENRTLQAAAGQSAYAYGSGQQGSFNGTGLASPPDAGMGQFETGSGTAGTGSGSGAGGSAGTDSGSGAGGSAGTGSGTGAGGSTGTGSGTGADIRDLEQQLANARLDLEDAQTQWNLQIEGIRSRYEVLDFQYKRIQSGESSTQDALKESYEASVKQENESWEAEEEKLQALKENTEAAQWNLDVASRRDSYDNVTAGQQARLAQIDRELKQIDINGLETEISRLDGIIGAGGRVDSAYDGTVILQEVVAGRVSSGEERLSIAFGDRVFVAEFDKEDQELAVGDLLEITIPGSSRTVEARISSMNLMGEETGTFQADLADLDLPLGTVTSYQCRRVSDTFQQVIPLSALRRDADGYYCLTVRSRSAVMGQEFRAERVELTVLSIGNTEAAVEGAIHDTDPLITSAGQVIYPGDRVRPVESLEG